METTHVKLPIGKGYIEADVPNVLKVGVPAYLPGVPDSRMEIRRAIRNPIGSKRLKDIAIGKKSAAIVVNDITRPYPGGLMILEIAEELHEAGLKDNDIFLVVAYGTHRIETQAELLDMFGEEVVKRFRFVHHVADDDSTLKILGKTEYGLTVQINKEFAEAEVKILTGLITPHSCAGFSGGRKSIVPGISGMECLKIHHSFPIVPAEPAMGWLEGNLFHEQALAAARLVGVDFIVNNIDNANREMIAAVAGDLNEAHIAGTKICSKIWKITIPTRADAVIVSPGGYPRDFDLHQAQKACSVAEMICKEGGHIILCAETPDGTAKFGKYLKNARHPKEVIEMFKKVGMTADATGKAYMWARGLLKHRISLVGSKIPKEELEEMFLKGYDTLEEAIEETLKLYGPKTSFVVVPQAADIFVNIEDEEKI